MPDVRAVPPSRTAAPARSSPSTSRGGLGQQRHDPVEQVAGRRGRAAPRPRTARRARAGGRRSRRPPPGRVSTLFATSSTGTVARRSRRASAASSSVMPACASTTSRIRSASAIARSACSRDERLDAAGAARRSRPCRPGRSAGRATSASTSTRSRVTPGMSCAIVSRRPNSRFTSVDLPTFCRPTTATRGSARRSCGSAPAPFARRSSSAARERLVDRRGRVVSSTIASSAGSNGFTFASRSVAVEQRLLDRAPDRAARARARDARRARPDRPSGRASPARRGRRPIADVATLDHRAAGSPSAR